MHTFVVALSLLRHIAGTPSEYLRGRCGVEFEGKLAGFLRVLDIIEAPLHYHLRHESVLFGVRLN